MATPSGAAALLAGLLLALIQIVPASAQACADAVSLEVQDDACGTTVALSVLGNAEGSGDCNGALLSCIVLAGAGNASYAGQGDSCRGAGVRCVVVSGAGNASADTGSQSCQDGTRLLPTVPFLPPVQGAHCIVGSGTGDASNAAGYDGCTGAVNCIVISGTGDASNGGHGYASSGDPWCTGLASCFVISGTGDAENQAGASYVCGQSIVGVQCLAASGTGNATTHGDAFFAGCDGTGSCIAVSGTGSADAWGGGEDGSCGTGSCVALGGGDQQVVPPEACVAALACDANECTAISIQAGEQACGTVLAASATGDARSSGHCREPIVACIAVSGTGNASNRGSQSWYCSGDGIRCVAVSGAGDATNHGSDSWGRGYYTCGGSGVACIAVSGTGDAVNAFGPEACVGTIASLGCLSISGTGHAATVYDDDFTTCQGYAQCRAVSLFGTASTAPENEPCQANLSLAWCQAIAVMQLAPP